MFREREAQWRSVYLLGSARVRVAGRMAVPLERTSEDLRDSRSSESPLMKISHFEQSGEMVQIENRSIRFNKHTTCSAISKMAKILFDTLRSP